MFEARKKEGLSGTDKADNTNSGAFTHTHTLVLIYCTIRVTKHFRIIFL